MAGFTKYLEENLEKLKSRVGSDENIIIRKFKNESNMKFEFAVVYEKNMIEMRSLAEGAILPVLHCKIEQGEEDILGVIKNEILLVQDDMIVDDMDDAVASMLSGKTMIIIDGIDKVIVAPTAGFQVRKISETVTEKIVRGPKEGFTELISTNISMIRRRIPDDDFTIINKTIGELTKTKIAVCYLKDQVDKEVLNRLIERLDRIQCRGIIESNNISEYIESIPYSPFKTIGSTERPDNAASKILEGKIVIICNGTPFVLVVPFLFDEYFHVTEDDYHNYIFSSVNRVLRAVAFFLTISTPGIYIALVTFHGEMIPTKLAVSIAQSREGVPFPTIVEALIYLAIFEFLRESSTRMPYTIGSTVGIVGALVIGQAAVSAKLVSPGIIIIISLVGITTFLIIELKSASIVFRLIFIMLSSTLGLYGYMFGMIGLIYYLSTIESFGVPYLKNIDFLSLNTIKKHMLRLPLKIDMKEKIREE